MLLNSILLQAQTGGAANPAGTGWESFIMIIVLIAIFYFFMIRPQSKKQKQIKKFREGLSVGDKVITAGGIYGKIRDIKHLLARNIRQRKNTHRQELGIPFCRRRTNRCRSSRQEVTKIINYNNICYNSTKSHSSDSGEWLFYIITPFATQ